MKDTSFTYSSNKKPIVMLSYVKLRMLLQALFPIMVSRSEIFWKYSGFSQDNLTDLYILIKRLS